MYIAKNGATGKHMDLHKKYSNNPHFSNGKQPPNTTMPCKGGGKLP
jgi:hypothetical protein